MSAPKSSPAPWPFAVDVWTAQDIARALAHGPGHRRLATTAPLDDIVCLARAVIALGDVAQQAAEHLAANQAVLAYSEVPFTVETVAASEAADATLEAARNALTESLCALGLVTLTTPETTDGSAA